ncbi:somatostatin receptor type 5-like [Haliotis rubra]|uniref:somatostatin receptor type 5-like n=1 Tax=Haliotis rubra TaxID=36100 RepID=UPI001EE5A6DB|nr:somatostatin receptor type 5-like [Haliotis rubra]
MDTENQTVLSLNAALVTGSVNAVGIGGNIMVIIVIARTAGLRGFSGALMINQAVAEVLQEVVIQFLIYHFAVRPPMIQLTIHVRLLLFGLSGVVSHSLSALSTNLYLAICKQHQYKTMVTWKRIGAFLCCSWIFNVLIVSLYHVVPSFYEVNLESSSDFLNINLTPSNWWFFLLLAVNIVLVPISSAATCFLKIQSCMKCPTMATLGPRNMAKVKLSQTIHLTTIIYLITFVPVLLVISLKFHMPFGKAISWAICSSYYIIKLLVYLKLYKPFRTTMKGMFCHNRVGDADCSGTLETSR